MALADTHMPETTCQRGSIPLFRGSRLIAWSDAAREGSAADVIRKADTLRCAPLSEKTAKSSRIAGAWQEVPRAAVVGQPTRDRLSDPSSFPFYPDGLCLFLVSRLDASLEAVALTFELEEMPAVKEAVQGRRRCGTQIRKPVDGPSLLLELLERFDCS